MLIGRPWRPQLIGTATTARWSVLELTYPRAQRFGKQEEPDARERFLSHAYQGRVYLGFVSPLRHNSERRGASFDDVLAPSTANSISAVGETHALAPTAEWGTAGSALLSTAG